MDIFQKIQDLIFHYSNFQITDEIWSSWQKLTQIKEDFELDIADSLSIENLIRSNTFHKTIIDEELEINLNLGYIGFIERLNSHTKDHLIDIVKNLDTRILELKNQSFPWPSTAIAPTITPPSGDYWPYHDSPLAFLGYKVGKKGVTAKQRQLILGYAYLKELPQVQSELYMSVWGDPETGYRLQKIANHIAWLTREKKKQRHYDNSVAIQDWEDDLQYLKNEYYDGRYDFMWPKVKD